MEESAPFSWWIDGRTRPSNHSHWLQETLSDLDEKIKMILNLIQDDGVSFTERAEKFYKKRPELLKILKDLHKSYQSLAEKYNKLRSSEFSPTHVAHLKSQFPSLKPNQIKTEEPPFCFSDSDPQPQSSDRIPSIRQCHCQSLKITEDVEGGLNKLIQGMELKGKSSCDVQLWEGLKVQLCNLMEDNLRQQSELIRRNDEKREMIKQLRAQISKLMEENRALKSCIPSYKVECKESDSRPSKFKGLKCLGNFSS